MQANLVTFVYVPFVLSRLTGTDFFDLPWYRNLPSFLVYSFPKGSYATGFGDDYEKMTSPSQLYMASPTRWPASSRVPRRGGMPTS